MIQSALSEHSSESHAVICGAVTRGPVEADTEDARIPPHERSLCRHDRRGAYYRLRRTLGSTVADARLAGVTGQSDAKSRSAFAPCRAAAGPAYQPAGDES